MQCIPTFEKVDIPRLKGDMSKWSPWLAVSSQEEWDCFFNVKVSALMEVYDHLFPWQTLVAAVQPRASGDLSPEFDHNKQLENLFDAEDAQPNVSREKEF